MLKLSRSIAHQESSCHSKNLADANAKTWKLKISKYGSAFLHSICYISTARQASICRVSIIIIIIIHHCLQPLLQHSLHERRALLREHFTVVPGEFDFAKSSDGETTDEIQSFLEESVKDGCEGLMVKMLESDASYYEPSRRSVNWLKVWVSLFPKVKAHIYPCCSSRKIILLASVIHSIW